MAEIKGQPTGPNSQWSQYQRKAERSTRPRGNCCRSPSCGPSWRRTRLDLSTFPATWIGLICLDNAHSRIVGFRESCRTAEVCHVKASPDTHFCLGNPGIWRDTGTSQTFELHFSCLEPPRTGASAKRREGNRASVKHLKVDQTDVEDIFREKLKQELEQPELQVSYFKIVSIREPMVLPGETLRMMTRVHITIDGGDRLNTRAKKGGARNSLVTRIMVQ